MVVNVLDFDTVSYQLGNISLLTKVSFSIKQDKIHAILGPNGAGKSTILKLALGLIKPTSGDIKISNGSINERENLRYVGSLIEAVSLYNNLTVFENLLITSLQRGGKKSSLLEVLDIVGLSDQQMKKAKDLSMGMKQRLGIAMAIVHKPKILLLDEPTNGLDPEGLISIREILLKLNALQNVAILLTSHVLSEIDKIADDITLIQNGNITFTGSTKKFKKNNNIEAEYLNRIKKT